VPRCGSGLARGWRPDSYKRGALEARQGCREEHGHCSLAPIWIRRSARLAFVASGAHCCIRIGLAGVLRVLLHGAGAERRAGGRPVASQTHDDCWGRCCIGVLGFFRNGKNSPMAYFTPSVLFLTLAVFPSTGGPTQRGGFSAARGQETRDNAGVGQ